MSLGVGRNDDGDDEERSSGSEGDDPSFDEDMEALRRACVLTGKDFPAAAGGAGGIGGADAALPDSDSDDDDLELVRRLQSRFFGSEDLSHALSRGPLAARPPTTMSDEEEDDFETLRAIQRRFCAYDQNTTEDCKNCFSTAARENELSDAVMVNKASGCENFLDNKDTHNSYHTLNNINGHSVITEHQKPPHKQPQVKYSSFPKSGQVFIDAIKKNRSCQKLLRSKLIQIEARIEEIKKLKERVKILKDFQISCRQRTGKALSQKKDPRVQLISARRTPKDSKVNDKKLSAMYFGPAENSHVASYRMALMKFPISLQRNKWSEVERENLEKGIKQQFQEMLLQISLNFFSASDGELCNFEDILSSIKDLEITSERMREFLPKVNWNQLASMYLPGRSGAECEARWLNWEDPLINQGRWTTQEDKLLLFIIQEKGINNWVDIAVSLGTNRTPFQCLSRYQRSLNACIIKSAWTPEEDAQLRAAVETFGESDWQAVASVLEGRTGTQCSNRWMKTLHPNRQRVGRWTKDEDARLRVAVKLFGAKNWRKIADFVPGRTQVQCRERWVNSLDPSLNWNQWTAEEDAMLEAAIAEHGYCWSKIAVCLSPRTDNQCRRRWKLLFPEEVPLLRQARKIQKAALIRNFVDRESERPGLGPGDFLPVPTISSVSNSQSVNPPRKPKSGSSGSEKVGSKRKRKTRPLNSDQVIEGNNEVVAGALAKHVVKPCSGKSRKPPQGRNSQRQHLQEQSLPQLDSTMLVTANSETTKIHGMPDIAKQGEIANRVQKVRCRRPRKEGQLNCEKVLDNYAAENCNLVLETRKAKKQGSREGRQSRRAKKHLSSPPNSVSTSLIHDESPQVLGMFDHTEKEENVISRVADTGKKSRVNGQCSSHQVLQIVNCKEDDRVTECGIVSRKRKVTKPCLREDDHGEPSKGCLPSPPHSSSLVVGKTIEVHGMSDITETRKNSRAKKETVSNKTKEDSHSRFNHSGDADKICMDAVTTDKDFKVYQRRRNLALDRCHNDSSSGPAVPAPPGNSCSLSLGFNEDEAEIRMTGNEPVSCQVPEIYDGDDTLASFLVKKQKKAGRIFKAGNRPALSSPSTKACLGAGKMPMNAGDKLGNSPSSLACSNDGAEMAMTGKESVSCPVLETDDCDDTLINFLVKKRNKGGGMLSAENRPAMSCPNSKACPGAGKMPMNAGH